jgi:hypothetical protein
MFPAPRDAFMLDPPRLLKLRVCAPPPRVSIAELPRPLKSRLPPLAPPKSRLPPLAPTSG